MTELAEYLQSLSEKRRQGFSASFEIRDAFRKAAVEIERQAAEIAKLRAAMNDALALLADTDLHAEDRAGNAQMRLALALNNEQQGEVGHDQ